MKNKMGVLMSVLCTTAIWTAQGDEVELIEASAETSLNESGFGAVMVEAATTGWADIDESDGELRYSGVGVMADFWCFNLGYAQKHFEWEQVDQLPFGDGTGDPWDELCEVNFGLGYGGAISEQWSWFGEAGMFSAYEEDVDGSFGYYAAVGGGYVLNDMWSFSAGIAGAGYRKIRTKWSMFPMLGVNWRADAEEGFSAMLGYPETMINYHFGPRATLSLFISSDGTVYRLADDSTVAAEGYMETDFTVAGVSLDLRVTKSFSLLLRMDYVMNGRLQVYDTDGDKLDHYDVGSTPRGNVTAVWMF